MAKITVNNPKNVINSKIGKNYFKLVGTGGPKGDKGDKGDTGAAATISAGTASSLPAGSSPTVTNSGTSSAAIFNFGIPKGDKGDKGDTGATGAAATITVGSTTTGAAGTNASVTNSGTSGAAVLNFTIPRGDKGETGATGATGQAATIAVGSTTTLAPGYNATVTNSGTSSAATFDFGIPQGAKGDTGATGKVQSVYVSELPASGDDNTFYLVDKNIQTQTASGSAFNFTNNKNYGSLWLDQLAGNATQNGTPTPDAPVAVNTTTGENVVKITGKNLFDKNNYSSTAGYFYSSDTIIGTGSATHNILFWIPCRPSTQYSLTMPTGYGIITKVATSEVVPANGVAVLGSQRYETTTINGYTTGATAKYLVAYLQAPNYTISDILSNITANLMVELGSTATAYEPYQGQEFEVNLGKNLLGLTVETKSDAGVDFTVTNGSIAASGTTARASWAANYNLVGGLSVTGNYPNYTTISASNSLTLPSGSYTLSASISNTGNSQGGLFIATGTSGSTASTGQKITTGTKTITLNEGELLYVSVWYEGTSSNKNVGLFISDIQLERGTQATDYASYFTPIELAKIGTYQDRIYKTDGKWYIEKQVGKTTLDGSEGYAWNYNPGTYSGFYRYLDQTISGVARVSDTRLSKANNFTCEESATTWTGAGKFGFSSAWVIWFEMMDNTITTSADFNTWLDTHNTALYYPLATPTTTEITEQALIGQLNFVASLYPGVNNIVLLPGTGAQGTMDISYQFFDQYNKHNVYIWNDDINDWQIIMQ